jgi:phage terminase large subunit
MPYIITTATKKIDELVRSGKRIIALPGGTSAGKTIGAEEVLIDLSQTDEKPTVTSIVSESLPHLKRGAIRDFKNIMIEQNYWRDNSWNATDSIYTFPNKSIIEFFGVDQGEKVKGPRRDRLFINEANNTSLEVFNQLEVRTKQFVLMDWNPSIEFYYYTDLKGKRDDIVEITLTYLDNEGLDPAIVRSIEQRRNNKSWWRVYGEGLLGEVEGKIYKDWQIIDEIPHEARLIRTGLDFGYSVDPTAIIDIYQYNGGYIVDEVTYEKGLLNDGIANILKLKENKALVIADSAEPKSIDEIKAYQVSILPASKGQGSVSRGIGYVQQQRISITKRSVNTIKEYRNYIWLVDKNGQIVPNEEDPRCANHSMSAIRYALDSLKPQATEVIQAQGDMWARNQARAELNSSK